MKAEGGGGARGGEGKREERGTGERGNGGRRVGRGGGAESPQGPAPRPPA